MAGYLFSGGRFLDPREEELRDGISVLVEDATVKEVRTAPSPAPRPRASTFAAAR